MDFFRAKHVTSTLATGKAFGGVGSRDALDGTRFMALCSTFDVGMGMSGLL
jgi:hypothetical protein